MGQTQPRHPYLEEIEPYQPPDLDAVAARTGVAVEDLVRLHANENPYGPSPRVAQALAEHDGYHVHPDYEPLKDAVARYAGVEAEQVVLSNGADEMIDLLIRLFVEPGEAIVTCPPTFGMYRFCARVNRCRVLTAPRRDDLSLDPAAVEERVRSSAAARMVFVVSPGNPSGQAIPLEVTERLLVLPVMVVVDEAYIAFGGQSAVGLLEEHENLVVVRTFSKWAGMAGLRLGYAAVAPHLARHLERVRAPYNVNAAAMVAALATLDDLETVRANVARLVVERERLTERLSAIPWLRPLPSQASFVLCRVDGLDAQNVVDGLLDRGSLIHRFSDAVMRDYVRISVGRPEQNDAVILALKELATD